MGKLVVMKDAHAGVVKNIKNATGNRGCVMLGKRRLPLVTGEDRNVRVINEFRENGGIVGGDFEGSPLLLLTTVGLRSGRMITKPLMYLGDGTRFIVFASKAGAPNNPSWYNNLVVNSSVRVEVGNEAFDANAQTLLGAERDVLYARQVALFPRFGDYQLKTDRIIPVVAITRT